MSFLVTAKAGARQMSNGTFKSVAPDHAISNIANGISNQVGEIANNAGISRFDVAVALANACGHILGDSKDMPHSAAMARINDLKKVMKAAYELRGTVGQA